jgi:hypothetical protein
MKTSLKALETLTVINGKLEEARMIQKCYPHLERNKWFYEQLEKLVELAIECEKILEKTEAHG